MSRDFNFIELLFSIQVACQFLDADEHEQIIKEAQILFEKLVDSHLAIAVFAPFKYGKSTLLNALLGKKILPAEILPTTGTAIQIKYGAELKSCITLSDGEELTECGTKILEQFTVLDQERTMRSDVTSVEVFCPHSLLKDNVEFLDLPGTNDMAAQDSLVRVQLLKADIVIQILDARQLFTLQERESLQGWLTAKGVETVIFVVNFLNRLEPNEQREVLSRACLLAERFRSNIPDGLSNLYRVDALPALLARVKNDYNAYHSSGLYEFETALASLIEVKKKELFESRLPRIQKLAKQVREILQERIYDLTTKIEQGNNDLINERARREKLAERLADGCKNSLKSFYDWLSAKSLTRYIPDAASALKKGEFRRWEEGTFRQALSERTKAVEKWVSDACTTFNRCSPGSLYINFPPEPTVDFPSRPSGLKGFDQFIDQVFNNGQTDRYIEEQYYENVRIAYRNAAVDYLSNFNNRAISKLDNYVSKIRSNLIFQPPEPVPIEELLETVHNLLALKSLLKNLEIFESIDFQDVSVLEMLRESLMEFTIDTQED